MKKVFAAAVIAAMLAGLPVMALASETAVQGMIQSVDPAGQSLTLVGGMTLSVPPSVSIEPLKPGEEVTVAYRDGQDGQKELTAFWIDAGPSGNSRH
jgi:hypothetical protein